MPDASLDSALAELSTIARNEELKQGMVNTSMDVVATPLTKFLLGPARPTLFAIAAASALLLLVACANAGALLLVHGAARRREVAVRLALGARRFQIVRYLFCEALLLSLAASALGVVLAYIAFTAIVSLAPIEVPRLDEAAIDFRALIFALGCAVGTAVLAGLFPAWRHSRVTSFDALHATSHAATATASSTRTRNLLVAAQLAAVVLLLTAAGLFVRSFTALLRLDLGFNPQGVLTFDVGFSDERLAAMEKQWALVDAVLDRARHLLGALAAGAVYQRPFAHGAIGMDTSIIFEGQPLAAESASRNPILNWETATPDYFRAMDIRLVQGRLFDEHDTSTSLPVGIIGESLAARLWPGQNPIGRRVLTYGAPKEGGKLTWQTVVGVVADVRYREIETPRFDLYLPYRQAPNQVQHFMVRFTGNPRAAAPALRAAVATLGPAVRIDHISTMDEVVGRAFAPWRFSSVVVSTFAVIALTFASVGVASLVAFAVTQRTREIGVRVALGAQTRDVVLLVARDGILMAGVGTAAGLLAAWILRRSIESMLFGVTPSDALTFGSVAVLLGIVSLVAAYLPARSVARIDPAVALRAE
jgi:predicted permease